MSRATSILWPLPTTKKGREEGALEDERELERVTKRVRSGTNSLLTDAHSSRVLLTCTISSMPERQR
jgi:hypothetical protein